METEQINDQPSEAENKNQEENPPLIWAAYMEGTDGKKHYLGNGKGDIRFFKKKEGPDGIDAYLDKVVSAGHRPNVHVHQIPWKVVVPVEDDPTPQRLPQLFDRVPIPISTMYPNTLPPTALDQLHEYEQKKKRRRRK